jgi:hypothetical protein
VGKRGVQGACGMCVVSVRLAFFTWLLAVRRRYFFAVPSPLPRCASQVLDRGAQANARGAAQVLDRGTKAAAPGAARCASQVLDRGARPVTRGAATLTQLEKNNKADVQRNR